MSYLEEAKSLLEAKKTTFSLLLDKLCELKREHGNLKTEIKLGLREETETETLRQFIEIIAIIDKIKSKIEHRVYELAESKLGIKNLKSGKKTKFLILLNELCELEYKYGVAKAKVRQAFRIGYGAGLSVGFRENIQALSEIPVAADKIKSKIKRKVRALASSKLD